MRRRAARAVVLPLLLAALATACGSGRSPDDSRQAVPPPAVAPTATASPAPQPATSPPARPSATPTVTTQPTPQPSRPHGDQLRVGDRGPAVLAWQQQLDALGYWLGQPDGTFGNLTLQATYALQKAAGLQRDGVVGPATRRALADGVRPRATTRSGRVVEIDLTRQLLLIVDEGHVQQVLNTSTGSGDTYRTPSGATGVAVTPRGSYRVRSQIDGMRISPLGELWRPKYFNGGIAVHGAPAVPPWPASHGCVRVTNAAMDWIWRTGAMPIGTPVLVR